MTDKKSIKLTAISIGWSVVDTRYKVTSRVIAPTHATRIKLQSRSYYKVTAIDLQLLVI